MTGNRTVPTSSDVAHGGRSRDTTIGPRQRLRPTRQPASTRADVLSDSALKLATQGSVTVDEAGASLCAQAERDRGYLVAAHVIHCQRMARRCADDTVYIRALGIIEKAIRLVPRPAARKPLRNGISLVRRRLP